MSSKIFHGETTHCRHMPKRHAFRYRMFWLAIDLDEIETLDRRVACFGHNRWSIAAIRDDDYGGGPGGGIREKVTRRLQDAGIDGISRITLLTIPRIFGYVFNPVSFYVCRDHDGRVRALIAEVRNTFGEMHHYVAQPEEFDTGDRARFMLSKEFYVSPFLSVSGGYEVSLRERGDEFDLQIDLRDADTVTFSARMRGRGVQMSSRALITTLLRFPLFAATIMIRIKWQALRLYFQRRLPVFAKPRATHRSTTSPARPGMWHRLRAGVVRRARRCEPNPASETLTPERSLS